MAQGDGLDSLRAGAARCVDQAEGLNDVLLRSDREPRLLAYGSVARRWRGCRVGQETTDRQSSVVLYSSPSSPCTLAPSF